MTDERRIVSKHSLVMNERENIVITGVIDVLSFDEDAVFAETEKGVIIIKGENLHVNRLNLDSGELDVEGMISAINYEDAVGSVKGKSSFLGRIFR